MNTTIRPPLSPDLPYPTALKSSLRRWPAISFSLLVCAFYLGTTAALPLVGKDEPRYVEVAREMFLRGDWVTPTLGGHTWFEKPALLYWFIIASFHIFGISEWAARIGPGLCGVATGFLVFKMAQRVEEQAAKSGSNLEGLARWSALAMVCSIGLIAFAHAATFDIVLTATITLALASFFLAELEEVEHKRRRYLAGLWIGVGLSLLAKGLVGFVLPGGAILLYFLMRRDWRGLMRLSTSWGLPLSLAVAAIWYGPVIARHGEPFINEFFVQHHFARYLSNKYKHPQAFYYYIPIIALFALPWTAFVLAALRDTKVTSWSSNHAYDKLRVFSLAWLLVPIAFFSLSGSKLPGYVLPALPGAILLAGIGISTYVREGQGRGYAIATGLALMTLGAAIAIYLTRSNALGWLSVAVITAPLIIAGGVTVVSRHRSLSMGLIGGALLVSISILTCGPGVALGESTGVRTLMLQANKAGYEKAAVWQMGTTQRTAEFYAADRLLYDAQGEPKEFQTPDQIAQALAPGKSVLVLVSNKKKHLLLKSPLLISDLIADNSEVALLQVRSRETGK